MTSQRLLKVLAFLSLLATIAAVLLWRQTGVAPSPWLVRFSIATFAAALLVGLIGDDTRPRIMLRFLAALLALIAVIAFAADFSHYGAAHPGFSATSLMTRWNELAPSLLAATKAAVMHSAPLVWEPLLTTVLELPAFMIFGALAALMGFAGRPRREIRIFVN